MTRRINIIIGTLLVVGLAGGASIARSVRSERADVAPRAVPVPSVPPTWDARAAASYLDARQSWWESWPKSHRDLGTHCVSCHTVMPYALARPALGAVLHDTTAPTPELKLVQDIITRVRAWNEAKPYYSGKGAKGRTREIQSRGSEAILNALVLASRDERQGTVSDDAQRAFANLFALQLTTGDDAGAWPWLDFSLQPWESKTATYFGAALAAVAIGREPQGYAERPEIQPGVARLRDYLRGHLDQPLWRRLLRRDDAALFNRAMLLWASARMPQLISAHERQAAVDALWDAQRADGGWSLAALGRWKRADGTSLDATSDGYATGLIAYALEQAGMPSSEPHLARALAWLAAHQQAGSGMWVATSLNKHRDPASYVGHFMSDAATAFASLALAEAQPSRALVAAAPRR